MTGQGARNSTRLMLTGALALSNQIEPALTWPSVTASSAPAGRPTRLDESIVLISLESGEVLMFFPVSAAKQTPSEGMEIASQHSQRKRQAVGLLDRKTF